MAGRGTDIKLGEGVTELGGLFVLGTERHESRRIDNQLMEDQEGKEIWGIEIHSGLLKMIFKIIWWRQNEKYDEYLKNRRWSTY